MFSSTWEEHLARLREMFERLRHAKLKLGAAKCTFAAKEVNYLGHRVTEEGLLPDSSLLAAIREIPPLKQPPKSALSWAWPATTCAMSRVLQPSLHLCMP